MSAERLGGSRSNSQPAAERQRAGQHRGAQRNSEVRKFSTCGGVEGEPDLTQACCRHVSLTQTLDQLSVNLSRSLNTSLPQVVQPNLVVLSAQVQAGGSQGVQFTSLTGSWFLQVTSCSAAFYRFIIFQTGPAH